MKAKKIVRTKDTYKITNISKSQMTLLFAIIDTASAVELAAYLEMNPGIVSGKLDLMYDQVSDALHEK